MPGDNLVPLTIDVIDGKNEYRMPYYHRLDLSLNFYFSTQKLSHSINLGVYNIYSRKNPLYYDWVDNQLVNVNGELVRTKRFVQVWLLPALPSLNYTIKF